MLHIIYNHNLKINLSLKFIILQTWRIFMQCLSIFSDHNIIWKSSLTPHFVWKYWLILILYRFVFATSKYVIRTWSSLLIIPLRFPKFENLKLMLVTDVIGLMQRIHKTDAFNGCVKLMQHPSPTSISSFRFWKYSSLFGYDLAYGFLDVDFFYTSRTLIIRHFCKLSIRKTISRYYQSSRIIRIQQRLNIVPDHGSCLVNFL